MFIACVFISLIINIIWDHVVEGLLRNCGIVWIDIIIYYYLLLLFLLSLLLLDIRVHILMIFLGLYLELKIIVNCQDQSMHSHQDIWCNSSILTHIPALQWSGITYGRLLTPLADQWLIHILLFNSFCKWREHRSCFAGEVCFQLPVCCGGADCSTV